MQQTAATTTDRADNGQGNNLKVRFGFTIGPDLTPAQLGPLVDDLERLGFDSIWVPEALTQTTLDPIAALTFTAARTSKLKLGTHLIIPGKNPVLLAKQLANLDQLSDGRLLVLAVLGLPDEADAGAQVITRKERGAHMAEVVPLLRRLWSGEPIDHQGPNFALSGVTVVPRPAQDPLEIWLAGQAPSALRRCGQLGDGWMPGLISPAEAAQKRVLVEGAAEAAGRSMDAEHYGINLFYANGPVPDEMHARLAARRPGGDIDDILPVGWDALRRQVDQWLDVGFSKFLLRPLVPPTDWTEELETLAGEILPLTV